MTLFGLEERGRVGNDRLRMAVLGVVELIARCFEEDRTGSEMGSAGLERHRRGEPAVRSPGILTWGDVETADANLNAGSMAPPTNPNPVFTTTHWSIVLQAAHSDPAAAGAALEGLCKRYWDPVHAFVRQRVYDAHETEDLTQEFFRFLLEREVVRQADRRKGRFRAFLLAALTNFLHNERDKRQTLKRGGGHEQVSLDENFDEAAFAADRSIDTPGRFFDRRWAEMIVQRVLDALAGEHQQRGKGDVYRGLQPFLTGEPTAADYERLGRELGMEPGAVKVALHRARRRFGELLRSEVAHTVERPEEVEEEIRHLLNAIAE